MQHLKGMQTPDIGGTVLTTIRLRLTCAESLRVTRFVLPSVAHTCLTLGVACGVAEMEARPLENPLQRSGMGLRIHLSKYLG